MKPIISVCRPGNIKRIEPAKNKSLGIGEIVFIKYPVPAIAIKTTPIKAVNTDKRKKNEIQPFAQSKTGLYVNKKGIRNPGAAIKTDFHATPNGFALAIPAAV